MFQFEWDPAKSRRNKQKHGISFEEARSIFADSNAKIIADPDHSGEEDRFILLGLGYNLRTLLVCHCYRQKAQCVRIISARKASKKEQKLYWEGLS